MHVFVTGGSGLVGTALIPQLVAAGHSVTALARSDKSAAVVSKLGATPVTGTHTDIAALTAAASKADAAIHLAFNHEIAFAGGMEQACDEDRAAITAICDALIAGGSSNKVFINTSGTLGSLGSDELSAKVVSALSHRARSEHLTTEYAAKGIKTYNLRLCPVVHGPGHEHPFISAQIAVAKKNKEAAYVGEGKNVWPSVHVKDAAALYVLALDPKNTIPNGANLHAVHEEGIPTREIAEFVGKKLNVPVKSVTPEEAGQGYGFIGILMTLDNRTSHKLTTQWTGWNPKEYGLFQELEGYNWAV
jgi:nucleoside-diphosphate-sugar epimerase